MKKVFVLFCLLVFTLSFANAEIFFSQEPNGLYNVGDSIPVNFSIEADFTLSDYVESYVLCDSEKFVVKKEYVTLLADTKKYFSNEFPAPIIGDCSFVVVFNDEEAMTNNFEISNEIIVDYKLNTKSFLPGEIISVNGTAKKENNRSFNGIAIFTILDVFEKSVPVEQGFFSFSFTLPDTIASGDYNLLMGLSEKNWKGDVLNSVEKEEEIKILRGPSTIVIFTLDTFNPPKNNSFKISLLDQVGEEILNESILIKIFDPLNELIFETKIASSEEFFYFFKDDSSRGGWSINAYYGDIFATKIIYIEENKKIAVDVKENRLFVENVGNVDYIGVVSFDLRNEFENKTIFLNVSIPVGEVYSDYSFNLGNNYTLLFEGSEFSITGASIFLDSNLTKKSYFLGFFILFSFIFGFIFKKKLISFSKKFLSSRKKKTTHMPVDKKMKEVISSKLDTCLIFMHFDTAIEMDDLLESYCFTFNPVGKNIGYILFYSPLKKDSEKKMFDFARTVKRFAKDNNVKASIVINSSRFEGMGEVKNFASFNRKLLTFSDGQILIPKRICDKIGIKNSRDVKKFNVLGRDVEVCIF